jgi:hypothetical protein
MRNSQDYLKYAEECERLAQQIPMHAQSLRQIADAWRTCAEEAERNENGRLARPAKEPPDMPV